MRISHHKFRELQSEYDFQIKLVEWFYIQYPREHVVHVPNEGKRTVQFGRKLKRMGMLKGFPDLLVPIPNKNYCGLVMELKKGNNKSESDQKNIQDYLESKGFKVCRDVKKFDQAVELIKQYMANR